jgi:hypothetical protein
MQEPIKSYGDTELRVSYRLRNMATLRARVLEPTTVGVEDELDYKFRQNPFRDRRGPYAHLAPFSIVLTVSKNGLLRALMLMAQPEPPKIPTEDPKKLAKFVGNELWYPVLKDLAITSVARFYEYLVMRRYADDDIQAGKFLRGMFHG